MPDRPSAPDGCEDKTIAASGGQSFGVGDLAQTPSMKNAGNRRSGGAADPTPLLD